MSVGASRRPGYVAPVSVGGADGLGLHGRPNGNPLGLRGERNKLAPSLRGTLPPGFRGGRAGGGSTLPFCFPPRSRSGRAGGRRALPFFIPPVIRSGRGGGLVVGLRHGCRRSRRTGRFGHVTGCSSLVRPIGRAGLIDCAIGREAPRAPAGSISREGGASVLRGLRWGGPAFFIRRWGPWRQGPGLPGPWDVLRRERVCGHVRERVEVRPARSVGRAGASAVRRTAAVNRRCHCSSRRGPVLESTSAGPARGDEELQEVEEA